MLLAFRIAACCTLGVAAICAETAGAQTDLGPIKVRGSVGFNAEAYTSSGPTRRAPAVLQVFAGTNFSLFGLSSGLDLTYSTDQSRIRQSVNRLAFSTRWNGGSAAAGDVSPDISRYTLSGTVLRGGYLELTPGPVQFALGGGRAQRVVEVDQGIPGRGQAYERYVGGGRLGLGDKSGTHLHLVSVYGRDVVSSVDEQLDVEPAENLVLAPEAGLRLWDGALFVRGAFAASAYTNDLRAESGGPSFPLFASRTGTSVDYATEATARLQLDRVGVTLDASRYNPGYRTIGIPRFRSDEQTLRGQVRLSLLRENKLTLNLSGGHVRDNLLDTRAVTTNRVTMGADASYRLSTSVNLSGGIALLSTSADPLDGTPDPELIALDFVSRSFRLSPVFTLGNQGGLRHVVSLATSYQMSEDQSPAVGLGLRPDNRTDNASGSLAYTLGFPSGISVTTTLTGLRGETATSRMDVIGATVGSGLSLWERRLTLNGTLGATRNQSRMDGLGVVPASSQSLDQLTAGLTAGYRLWGSDTIRLSLRGLATQAPTRTFRELRATLRYTHSF